MPNQEKLREIAKRVNLLLDQDLTPQEERDLIKELRQNQAYLKIFGQEKAFRQFIKSSMLQQKPSPDLIQSIKENIKTKVPV